MENNNCNTSSPKYLYFHSKKITKYIYFRSLTIEYLVPYEYQIVSGVCSNFFELMNLNCKQTKKKYDEFRSYLSKKNRLIFTFHDIVSLFFTNPFMIFESYENRIYIDHSLENEILPLMIYKLIPSIICTKDFQILTLKQKELFQFLNKVLRNIGKVQSIIIANINSFQCLENWIKSSENLKQVTLKNIKISRINLDIDSYQIFGILAKNTSIESIEINNCFTKSFDMKHIKILLTNKNLKNLSILKTNLDHPSLIEIQKALKTNNTLKSLVLYSFGCNKESIEIICEIIKNNNLESLGLLRCNIDDDDFSKLLSAVKINKSLKLLNLSGNKMTDLSLNLLHSDSLKENICLKEISLKKCKFTNEGIRYFLSEYLNIDNQILFDLQIYLIPKDGLIKFIFYDS